MKLRITHVEIESESSEAIASALKLLVQQINGPQPGSPPPALPAPVPPVAGVTPRPTSESSPPTSSDTPGQAPFTRRRARPRAAQEPDAQKEARVGGATPDGASRRGGHRKNAPLLEVRGEAGTLALDALLRRTGATKSSIYSALHRAKERGEPYARHGTTEFRRASPAATDSPVRHSPVPPAPPSPSIESRPRSRPDSMTLNPNLRGRSAMVSPEERVPARTQFDD